MYIIKDDYKGRINTDLLNILLSYDEDDILAYTSKTAEDTISQMVGVLYDIAPEFSKTGTARNHFILSMAIHIALYNIYQRADDEEIPPKIIKNYDDTIDDLVKISNGKMSLNLPAKVTGTGGSGGGGGDEDASTTGDGLRRMGSAPKRSHRI